MGKSATFFAIVLLIFSVKALAQEYEDMPLSELQQKAASGDAAAQYQLGYRYSWGTGGVGENDYEAVKWYRKGAENNNPYAQFMLGIYYQIEEGGLKKDCNEVVKWFSKSAEQGFHKAQLYLGDLYHNGDCVQQNLDAAMEWFQKAAAQGSAQACNEIGRLYQEDVEFGKAIEWYKKAAVQGLDIAQNNLAILYYKFDSIAEAKHWYMEAAKQGNTHAITNLNSIADRFLNDNKLDDAFQCYLAAANLGNVEAQYSVGYCYQNGKGVNQDIEKAKEWYRKAASQGDENAKYVLEKLEPMRKEETHPLTDEEKFADWLEHANNGEAWAQYNVAWAYNQGRGVSQNDYKAFEWFQKAATQGHKDAQYFLGRYYYEGKVTTQNYNKAFDNFKKSAEQECTYSYDWLGLCYHYGKGVSVNYDQAKYWYEKSGSDYAKSNLAGMEKDMAVQRFCSLAKENYEKGLYENAAKCYAGAANKSNNVNHMEWAGHCYYKSKNYSDALFWFQKAHEQNSAFAQNYLGIMYEYGLGTSVNNSLALQYYQMSMNQGDQGAKQNYQNLIYKINNPSVAQSSQNDSGERIASFGEALGNFLTTIDRYKNPQAYYNTSEDYGNNSYAGSSSSSAAARNREFDREYKEQRKEIEKDKNNIQWRKILFDKYSRCLSELNDMKDHREPYSREKRKRLQSEMRDIRREGDQRGVKPPISKDRMEDWDGDED